MSLARKLERILSKIGRDTWRNPIAFFLVWVPTLTVFILSFNPALTADLAPAFRVAFWLLHVTLLLPMLMIAQGVVDDRLASSGLHPFILIGLAGLGASIAFAPVSLLLDLLFSPATDLGAGPSVAALLLDEVIALALPTLCVWLLVNGARLTMLSVPVLQEAPEGKGKTNVLGSDEGPSEHTDTSVALTEVEKAFWSKVPRELGVDVVSLSAEQHYLHVATTKGRSLILFPISRAIDAVERLHGMRIHRSHWVAMKHVTSISKEAKGLAVTLTSGETLPVSRANRPAVRELLDKDALRRAVHQLDGASDTARLP
jgi:hypothetical protein